jgi:hypothetical protein
LRARWKQLSCDRCFFAIKVSSWKSLEILHNSGYWFLDTTRLNSPKSGCFWISLQVYW